MHEPNSSLGSPNIEVSLYDNFESSYQSRSILHDVMPWPSLEPETEVHISLSSNFATHTSSQKDITHDVLIFANPPSSLNHSCKFEDVEDFENSSEKHHDKSEAICF